MQDKKLNEAAAQFKTLFKNSPSQPKIKSEIDTALEILILKADFKEIEKLIEARPALLDEKGNLENPYAPCPKNLTLFQCALFYEDHHATKALEKYLKKYLTQDQIQGQLDEFYEAQNNGWKFPSLK